MANLFTRTGTGIGLSFIRNPMGASDLARFHYSYDDLPAGQTDPTLASFSIAHDLADIVPLVQQARALNPQLVVMATPWSPPGWMKTSGSLIGGSLLASAYAPFANYFVKYIQAYQAAGIPIDYVSLQNEPLYVPGDYPGMSMDAATQLAVLKLHLLPALTSAGLTTKALVYDHNWDRPDYPDTRAGRSGDRRFTARGRHRVARLWRHARRDAGAARQVPAGGAVPDRALGRHVGERSGPRRLPGDHPRDAQLGPRLREVGTGARPESGPARRRLRHLHAAGDSEQPVGQRCPIPSTSTRWATSASSCCLARAASTRATATACCRRRL